MTEEHCHPDHMAEFGADEPDPERAVEEIKELVRTAIKELEADEALMGPFETLDLEQACQRALVPFDSPDARLALRYEGQARATLVKAGREIDRLQKERYKAEMEAERNEAKAGVEPPASEVPATDCVKDSEPGGGGSGDGSGVEPPASPAEPSQVSVDMIPVAPVAPPLTVSAAAA